MVCGYAGSSLEVKIETDSNDAMEIKTEADCNNMSNPGMLGFSYLWRSFASFVHYICLHYIRPI